MERAEAIIEVQKNLAASGGRSRHVLSSPRSDSRLETEAPVAPRRPDGIERPTLLDTLHEPRFVDLAPAEVFATLLDEGRYLGSVRSRPGLPRT